MLGAVILTQYRRVTDGRTDRQTDGIAVASTVLAMPALWHAVKTNIPETGHSLLQCHLLTSRHTREQVQQQCQFDLYQLDN